MMHLAKMSKKSRAAAVGDTIENTAPVVHSMAFLTNDVTPVLVTGAHFSTSHNAGGTMETGDKRRYDTAS